MVYRRTFKKPINTRGMSTRA